MVDPLEFSICAEAPAGVEQEHFSRRHKIARIWFQWLISSFFAVLSVLIRSDPGYVHYCTVYVSHPRTAVSSLFIDAALNDRR